MKIQKKYTIVIFLLVSLMTGCSFSRDHGECIGLNSTEDPNLIYHYDARNIAVGIIFSEMIAPPIFVLLDGYKCPVGKKDKKQDMKNESNESTKSQTPVNNSVMMNATHSIPNSGFGSNIPE